MGNVTFNADTPYHQERFTKGAGPVTITGTFTPGAPAPKGEGRGHRLFGIALEDNFPPNGFPRRRKFSEYPPVWLVFEAIERGDVVKAVAQGHGGRQETSHDGTALAPAVVVEGVGTDPFDFEITFDGDYITGSIAGKDLGKINTYLDAEEGEGLVWYMGMPEGGKLTFPDGAELEYEISVE